MFANRVLGVVCCAAVLACAPARAEDGPRELNFQNAQWGEVLGWYADATGVVLTGNLRPAGAVTLGAKGRKVTPAEATDLINEALMQQRMVVVRRELTFALIPTNKQPDPATVPQVRWADLATRGRTEVVVTRYTMSAATAGAQAAGALRLLNPLGAIVGTHGLELVLMDTVGNLVRVGRTLDAIAPPGAVVPPPKAAVEQAPAPRVAPKRYAIHFKDAPWGDVVDWYAKETGLVLITTVKPTGKFTFVPPDGARYTLGEITDILNDALVPQKFILVRRHLTFFIQPPDEKLDPPLVSRATLDELAERGRTEIVQVILPVTGVSADEAATELKKLLTPFGVMAPLGKQNALLVQDTAGNILRIKKALDALSESKPKGK